MRIFMIITILILGQFSTYAQENIKVESKKIKNGELLFELQIDNEKLQLDEFEHWIKSTDHFLSGEILKVNSNEFVYKGKSLIYLSKKPSTFQTEIFFTLQLTKDNESAKLVVKDVYYKSLPEYGKQGSVGIYSYCQDWFSNKKLYKKSGKTRALNQNLLNNSTQFAEELLLSCIK